MLFRIIFLSLERAEGGERENLSLSAPLLLPRAEFVFRFPFPWGRAEAAGLRHTQPRRSLLCSLSLLCTIVQFCAAELHPLLYCGRGGRRDGPASPWSTSVFPRWSEWIEGSASVREGGLLLAPRNGKEKMRRGRGREKDATPSGKNLLSHS